MERGFDALQKAPVVLLKKFVLTLGVMVYYAGKAKKDIGCSAPGHGCPAFKKCYLIV